MNIISMKQLREDFSAIKQRLQAGEELLLIYRSQPLAEIRPIKKRKKEAFKKRDYAKIIEKLAGGFKLGVNLTPEKLSKIYDKQYEEMLSGL